MPHVLTYAAANQDSVIRWLLIIGFVALALTLARLIFRGRHLTIGRPRAALIGAAVTIAAGVALAYSFAAYGPTLKLVLTTSAPTVAKFLDRVSSAELRILQPATDARPLADLPQRRALSEIACKLLLQEKQVTVSGMDDCIASGIAQPDEAFRYITGESLGASWQDLSDTEKGIAVEKAQTDAAGPHQTAHQVALIDAYQKCELEMMPKRDAYIQARCKFDVMNGSINEYWNCTSRVQRAPEFQQFNCAAPF